MQSMSEACSGRLLNVTHVPLAKMKGFRCACDDKRPSHVGASKRAVLQPDGSHPIPLQDAHGSTGNQEVGPSIGRSENAT